jgi:glyoxylase-like metal-dependent hydrolase (beta-lactamase superfamily II)
MESKRAECQRERHMEIAPNIHQLRIPIPGSPLQCILCYLILGDEGHILVDTGWNVDYVLDLITSELKGINVDFSEIAFIVVTHSHADHFGLAGRIKELSNAKVLMHRLDGPPFTSWPIWPPPGRPDPIKGWLLANGLPEEDIASLEIPDFPGLEFSHIEHDLKVEGGETVSSGSVALEVIWTPGHSPGHICLYESERKVLFAGDHLLPQITPNVGLRPPRTGNPLADYLASLRRMEDMEVELVLPAHEHAFSNFQERLRQIQRHHDERLKAVLDAVVSGAKTAYEITAQVPWDIGAWQDMSMWDRYLALGEALAHLEFLLQEGRVRKDAEGAILLFQPA